MTKVILIVLPFRRHLLSVAIPGHRLKSANNKTSTMFEALRTPRRIILSGTPIQNDLGEFHAMVRTFVMFIIFSCARRS